MIPVYYLEYNKNKELDMEVTRFVNDNLLGILSTYIDVQEGLFARGERFISIIPEGCYAKKNFNEEKKIKEIVDLLSDNLLRTGMLSISPVNEKIIYNLIQLAYELSIDDKDGCIIMIPTDLKMKIIHCDDYYAEEEIDDNPENNIRYNFVLEDITEWTTYFEFLFQDFDFFQDFVDNSVAHFIKGDTKTCEMLGIDWDFLVKSEELMSAELHEKFIEYKNMRNDKEQGIFIKGDNNIVVNESIDNHVAVKQESNEKKNWISRNKVPSMIIGITTAVAAILGLITAIVEFI